MANALDHLASGRTRTEWLSQLNTEYRPAKNYRRTSIIGTIGKSPLLLALAVRFPRLTFSIPGPKTNSAEKINMLRRGAYKLTPRLP